MERSEVLIFLNKSSTSSHRSDFDTSSEIQNGGPDSCASKVISKVIDKVLQNGTGDEVFFPENSSVANNVTLNNSTKSFSSSNSSPFRKSLDNSSFEFSNDDNNDNNNLRNLLGHILVKIDVLEDQLNDEKKKYEEMRDELNYKIKKLRNSNKSLTCEINNIYDDLFSLDCRTIHVEQYSRRDCIVISGIPDNIPQENLEPTVLKIIKGLGVVNVSSFEISACHRLFKKKYDRYPARTIIKFTNRKIADKCLENRERIFEVSRQLIMNLRVFESLCEANEKILKHCIELHKYEHIQEFYITNGSIKIIKNRNSRPYKIKHPDNLYHLFKDFFECEDLYML